MKADAVLFLGLFLLPYITLSLQRNFHLNRLDTQHPHLPIQNRKPRYRLSSIGTLFPSKRATPPVHNGWRMGECIYDSQDRILKDLAVIIPDNSPDNCIGLCDGKGFHYAGLEYGDECWCANTLNGTPTSASVKECNMPCSADESLPCGGAFRMILFTKDGNVPPASYVFSSIANPALPQGRSRFERVRDHDEPDDILPSRLLKTLGKTPCKCASAFFSMDYQPADLESGRECRCDYVHDTTGGESVKIGGDSKICGKPCTSGQQQGRRDGWMIDPYPHNPPIGQQKRDANDMSSWDEGPCMVDQGSARLLKNLSENSTVSEQMSPQRCLSRCASQGMDLAGLQGGTECWCGDLLNFKPGESAWERQVNLEECSIPCGTEKEDICGGPWRMRLFGKYGALEQYRFGYTSNLSSGPATPIAGISAQSHQPLTPPSLLSLSSIPSSEINLPLLGDETGVADDSTKSPTVDATSTKKVIAHHMVGNTYSYTIQSWLSDVKLAKDAGIDGFALNLGAGGNSWQKSRVGDAFSAASAIGGFGMILSFDMTVLGCQNQADADVLRDYILTWGVHPGHLTIPPANRSTRQRIIVSTFAGEYCTFGKSSVHDGWLSVVQDPQVTGKLRSVNREIAFVPSWFARADSRKQEFEGAIQGDFHWNGGWPMGSNDINWDTDAYHLQNNPGPVYMASVSPWFFTHYGPNSFNKNWIYRGDNWLYAERWELLFRHRSQVDLVEIVTWNDYGESSYIGPINGDQPNSQGWVDGYPHLGFLDMTSYYAQGYKTGRYPTISQDKVYIWSRPHPRDANACCDSVGRPNNYQWTEDYLWGIVMATGAGEFNLISGSNSQTFTVSAGINKFKVPNSPGHIRGTLTRLGMIVVDVNPGNSFLYTNNPTTFNYNVFMTGN